MERHSNRTSPIRMKNCGGDLCEEDKSFEDATEHPLRAEPVRRVVVRRVWLSLCPSCHMRGTTGHDPNVSVSPPSFFGCDLGEQNIGRNSLNFPIGWATNLTGLVNVQ
jgi:hypothetical protein